MSKRNDVNLRIGGDTRELDQSLRRSRGSWDNYERGVRSTIGRLGRNVSTQLRRAIVNPFTGLMSAGALIAASKKVVDYDLALTRMAIQAGISAKEQMKLKNEIQSVAESSVMSRDEIASGMAVIVEKLGNLSLARDLMKDLAIASTATGASMESLAAVAANLYEKMGLSREEISTALNTLTVQGNAGAFTLKNLAELGERLFSAAARFNIQGKEGIRSFGAFLQMAKSGVGDPASTATAVENTLTEIITKSKEIRKYAQFDIYDPAKSKKGLSVLKDFDTVIKGIISGTKGDIPTLLKIFGDQSIKAISPLAMEFQKTGRFDQFDKYRTADIGNETELMKEYARAVESTAKKFEKLSIYTMRFADVAISPAIENLANSLDKLTSDPQKMKQIEEELVTLGNAFASLGKLIEAPVVALKMWEDSWTWLGEHFYGSTDKQIAARTERARKGNLREGLFVTNPTPFANQRKESPDSVRLPGENGFGFAMRRYMEFWRGGNNEQKPAKVDTQVNVNILPDGRATAETKSTGGTARTSINLPRGSFRRD